MDCGEEISGGFVVARCDGAKLLELAEEIFDEMPRLVHLFVEGARDGADALAGVHRGVTRGKDRVDHALVVIISLVCENTAGLQLMSHPAGPCQMLGIARVRAERG